MIEEWKDIKGYEGKYQVSNTGKVRSLKYRRSNHIKEMAPQNNGHGYYWVAFRNGSGKKDYNYVHRLVAEAFIENPHGYETVNHLDEDMANNMVDNLEWCTMKYNLSYGTRHSREIVTQQKTHPNRKAVAQYDINGKLIKVYGSQREAARDTGLYSTSISMCCRGKLKTTGGYVFSFA